MHLGEDWNSTMYANEFENHFGILFKGVGWYPLENTKYKGGILLVTNASSQGGIYSVLWYKDSDIKKILRHLLLLRTIQPEELPNGQI